MQSMKGATSLLGSMNRQMNLPALQRIAMEFEKENDVMDQRQEMMDDAIDDVTGLEDEEEGEEVVKEVLDEIGVDLGQAVCSPTLRQRCNNEMYTDTLHHRWERHHRVCTRPRWPMEELRKRLAEAVQTMTISKQGWTVSGDNLDWITTAERRLSAIWEKYGIRGYGVRGVRCAESFDIKFWRPWELRSY